MAMNLELTSEETETEKPKRHSNLAAMFRTESYLLIRLHQPELPFMSVVFSVSKVDTCLMVKMGCLKKFENQRSRVIFPNSQLILIYSAAKMDKLHFPGILKISEIINHFTYFIILIYGL